MNRRKVIASLAAGGLALLLAGAAVNAYSLYRAHVLNDSIREGDLRAVPDGASPEVLFARAHALRGNGKLERAIAAYGRLLPSAGPELALAAQYNLGNLYFIRAAIAADETRLRDVLPLVMRARAHYQRVLFLNSDHYDAKYNLEYVERLVETRELKDEKESVGVSAQRSRDDDTNWVTVHELPEGLP